MPCIRNSSAANTEAVTCSRRRRRSFELKWLRFLLVHGEEFGFDESVGPDVELVEHFTTYCFSARAAV